MDVRYKKLAKNSGVMLVGNLSSKLISFLLLPVYTHFLSTEAYGESDMITVYASILLALVSCCVADGMFVFPKNVDVEGKKKYFTSGLLFVFLTFGVLSVILFVLDLLNVGNENSGVILLDKWWIFLMSFSMFLQQYTQQFTLSLEKTTQYSIAGVVMTVLMAVLAIILLPKYGLPGYLWSIILANLGAALFSFVSSKSYLFFSLRHIDLYYIKELLQYGIPLIPNSIMWWLVNGLNRPMMEINLGLSAIGIFSVANRFPSVLTMVFQVIGKGMSISVLDEFGKKDFNLFYNNILRILTLSVLMVGIVLCVSSKLIISIFADKEFFAAWQYMPMLTLAVIFQCMGSFIGNIFMAEKKSKYFFYSSFWGAAASLVLTFVLIKYWGLFGVCIALVGSFLVMFIVRLFYAWKHINLFNISYYSVSFLLYSCLVAIITMDCSISIIAIYLFLYLLVTYLMNKKDINNVVNKLKTYIFRSR